MTVRSPGVESRPNAWCVLSCTCPAPLPRGNRRRFDAHFPADARSTDRAGERYSQRSLQDDVARPSCSPLSRACVRQSLHRSSDKADTAQRQMSPLRAKPHLPSFGNFATTNGTYAALPQVLLRRGKSGVTYARHEYNCLRATV
jgi:hypothetical protein